MTSSISPIENIFSKVSSSYVSF